MSERVVLITGGAKGIGRAIGLDLAGRGWSVALCYRTSEKEAEETAVAIREKGVKALAVRADVSDPKAAERFVKEAEGTWGRIDALVHAAGPYHRVNLLEETIEGWHEMFDHNLHPLFYLARLVTPAMKARRWGRIVSFSMANADQMIGQPQITAHYISKVGVLILTRSLAKLLAPHGITVNAISPGFIRTGSAPESEMTGMIKNIPAGYVGEVTDAVAVARFLLSDEARYVTGGNIHLSGGWGV
ncbi:MAG: SDR family oxidoreductase [Nitrospirae bacterium]|nr:SDR family oxidoreductase [Candidatus Manganitrophaceae bacterium]